MRESRRRPKRSLWKPPAPRHGHAGPMPVPLAEVLRIAGEYERGGRLDDAKRLLDHILAVAPHQGDALHLPGIVAFRMGDPAEVARPDGAGRCGTASIRRSICATSARCIARWAGWTRRWPRRSARRRWRRPIRCACTTRRSSTTTAWNSMRRWIARGSALRDRSQPAGRAFRACRGAAAARRNGGGLGGIRMALPHRRCRAADAADRQAAMGRHAVRRPARCC